MVFQGLGLNAILKLWIVAWSFPEVSSVKLDIFIICVVHPSVLHPRHLGSEHPKCSARGARGTRTRSRGANGTYTVPPGTVQVLWKRSVCKALMLGRQKVDCLGAYSYQRPSEVWQERSEGKVHSCTLLWRRMNIAALLVTRLHLKWVGKIMRNNCDHRVVIWGKSYMWPCK